MIDEGQAIVRACIRQNRRGPYQVQAAIGAVHAETAVTGEATDWPQVVGLCDQLLALAPTPFVALNRAIAISEVDGPGAGLDLVGPLRGTLGSYYPFHATHADLLRRAGTREEAARPTRLRPRWSRGKPKATTSPAGPDRSPLGPGSCDAVRMGDLTPVAHARCDGQATTSTRASTTSSATALKPNEGTATSDPHLLAGHGRSAAIVTTTPLVKIPIAGEGAGSGMDIPAFRTWLAEPAAG